MAQASELTDQALNYNKMPGKQTTTTKQISTTTASARLLAASTKKLPTPSPSSYTFAPRWMAKASPESRPSSPTSTMTDENFPSLSTLGEDDDGNDDAKKKRSVWNDPTTVKRKVISPAAGGSGVPSSDGTDDPFAGMNTLVDYQQEIERLKALVPKVENKKRASTGSTPRPKSTGSDLKQRLLWNDLRSAAAAAAAAGRSGSSVKSHVSPTTRPMIADMLLPSMSSSNSSSVASDDDIKSDRSSQFVTDESQPSEDKDDDGPMEPVSSTSTTKSVITEEEKARFLEFMRSWTGGWQGWDKNNINNNNNVSSNVRRDGWVTRRRSWNEPISNRVRPDPLNITMLSSTTTTTQSRYIINDSLIQSEPSTPLGNSMYEAYWSDHAVVTAPTSSKHEELFRRHHHNHPHPHPHHHLQQPHHLQHHLHNHQHQHQQQTPSYHHHSNLRYGQQPPNNHYDSLQIGAIGDKNSVRGLPRMGGGGAPFGVFVM